jgi:hypothetical protein
MAARLEAWLDQPTGLWGIDRLIYVSRPAPDGSIKRRKSQASAAKSG